MNGNMQPQARQSRQGAPKNPNAVEPFRLNKDQKAFMQVFMDNKRKTEMIKQGLIRNRHEKLVLTAQLDELSKRGKQLLAQAPQARLSNTIKE